MARSRKPRPRKYTPTRGQFAGRTFRTMGEYRKELARANKRQGKAAQPIRTRKDLDALSEVEREKRSDAIEVLSLMRREGLGLRPALRRFKAENPGSRLGERSALKYIRPALHKAKGRWTTKSSDRLLRIMLVPTKRGVVEIEIRDSRTASSLGAYWNAVRRFLETGDTSGLRPFRGKFITVGKLAYPFVTDPRSLSRLAEGGEFELDSIYDQPGSRS